MWATRCRRWTRASTFPAAANRNANWAGRRARLRSARKQHYAECCFRGVHRPRRPRVIRHLFRSRFHELRPCMPEQRTPPRHHNSRQFRRQSVKARRAEANVGPIELSVITSYCVSRQELSNAGCGCRAFRDPSHVRRRANPQQRRAGESASAHDRMQRLEHDHREVNPAAPHDVPSGMSTRGRAK